jgi:hypothetical protein
MQRSQVGQNTANGKVERQTGEQMDAGGQANHALATQRRRCMTENLKVSGEDVSPG